MCLAAPGEVVALEPERLRATVDFFGNRREVSVAFVPEVKVGDFVLIHVGEAIEIVSESEARETLELWGEIYGVEELE